MPNDAALGRRRKSETAPRPLNATPQRPATARRRVATTRHVFYEPINLAKVLTDGVHATLS